MRIATALLLFAGLLVAGGADQAAALLAKGDHAKAIAATKRLTDKDPKNLDAWLVMADAQLAAGEPGDAWESLELAIEHNPAAAPLAVKLGDVFVKMAEREQAGNGDGTTITNYYLDADRMYQEGFTKDPKSADALYGRAFVNFWLAREDTKKLAKKLVADALALNGDHAKAHALQAYMFYLDKKYPEAQAKYEIALKLDTTDVLNFVRYGHTFYAQGKWDEAKKAYIAGLAHHPLNTTPILSGLYHLANRDKNPKSWANLQPFLEEAVKVSPKSAPSWYYLGYCHFANERWDDAMRAYGKADEIDPNNAAYIYSLGYTQEKMGNEKKALDGYRAALKINPGFADPANAFYRIILAKAGNIAEAEKYFEELIELSPGFSGILNDYALILRDWAEKTGSHKQPNPPSEVKKRLARSSEVYEMAAALEPDSAQIQSDTGLLFEYYPCIEDAAKAKRYFITSLEKSDFAYRDAFDGLDRICRRTKDWETLEEYADRVLGSLERGNDAIAPVRAGAPRPLPNESPGLKARAQAALNVARAGLKKG